MGMGFEILFQVFSSLLLKNHDFSHGLTVSSTKLENTNPLSGIAISSIKRRSILSIINFQLKGTSLSGADN